MPVETEICTAWGEGVRRTGEGIIQITGKSKSTTTGGGTWALPLTPTPLPTRPIPNRTEAWGEGAPLTAPVESMRMTDSKRPHAVCAVVTG
jgi:hypothetical protein